MSRLAEGSIEIRNKLEARNLYTPTDPYNLDNRQLVNTINALAGIIKPFSSFDLTNTVIGRLIGPNTPIAQIGLVMLGKQFAATVASNASAAFLPTIKFSNLFDGDPSTKFFMVKQDFQITRREGQSNLGRILDSLSGVKDYFNTGNPFKTDTNSADYVANTGKGQLQFYIDTINKNVYKLEDSGLINAIEDKGLEISLGNNIIIVRDYYSTVDANFYPFAQYQLMNVGLANLDYRSSEANYLGTGNNLGVKEYGHTQNYLNDLGKTTLGSNSNGANEFNFNSSNFGLDDTGNNQLVWGRDGAADYYKETLGDLIEDDENELLTNNKRFSNTDKFDSFNIKTGLLNYTKELLNAKGKYGSFDLTRKKFQDTNGQIHFNGSPLDTHPDGEKDYSRRHSMSDPYDRYAKAIRFDGNVIYNGNPDSVIYKTVIPKFAPSFNKGLVDNRNLMFSIENLAAQTIIGDDGIGYLNDDTRTAIPPCEVGQNGGRLLWFPPYDVKLSEQSVASWTANQFIGRAEKIYTYSNTERMASLSFKLLADYPQQILNYRNVSENDYHKKLAEFFAFGGEATPIFDTQLDQKEALLTVKIKEREEIEPITRLVDPNVTFPSTTSFYFPNDYPKQEGNNRLNYTPTSNVDTILKIGYEDGVKNEKDVGGVDNGSNIDFIFDYVGVDNIIKEYFNPDDNTKYNNDGKPYLSIAIESSATVLYNNPIETQQQYNFYLSKRRQLSVRDYIEKRIKEIFGKTAQQLNILIDVSDSLARGSSNSNPNNNTVESIFTLDAIKERVARIIFNRSDAMITQIREVIGENKKKILEINAEIDALQNDINSIKRRMIQYSPCVYESPIKTDGIEKGFKSLYGDKFYPVFHTQTPEDLHRRLTFLHQCTRQGPAIRVPIKDKNGETVQSSKNSVFGRQPICVFRYGDFFHTKIIIENVSFGYEESTWDLNPEGFGMQPMIVDVTLQIKILGGQSLATPIDALQNAVSFNYYANSTFVKTGLYATPAGVEATQITANGTGGGLSTKENQALKNLTSINPFTQYQLQQSPIPNSLQ